SANIMPVYMALRNPLVLDGEGPYLAKLRAVNEAWGLENDPVLDESQTPNPAWAEEFTAAAQARGHDGVILPSSSGETEYVAFDPEQIKSATGNRGTFDPADPNILHQLA